MNQLMFTVLDVKSESFLSPFFAKTDGEAIRMILEVIRDGQSMLSKYPLDYRLLKIGSYDTMTGVVTPLNHIDLGSCYDIKRAEDARYNDYEADARGEIVEPMVK